MNSEQYIASINNETAKIIETVKGYGFRVYVRPHKGARRNQYAFVTDGERIAYIQWSDSRPHVASVHKPCRYNGTGFRVADEITKAAIIEAMNCHRPQWAIGNSPSVKKYRDWKEYQASSKFNSELVEV